MDLWFRHCKGDFNSQPHKEADSDGNLCICTSEHFNSQPHKEADARSFWTSFACCISTHSLTRRLTCRQTALVQIIHISTHSLTRRLTAISFNKNCFLHFIFITIYQSPPHSLLLSPLFRTLFSHFQQKFQVRISRGLGGSLGFAL